MKKTIAVLFAMAAAAVFAGTDDLLITFSTPGPDKYADGTTVLDNECYALVYTVEGKHTKVITVPAAKDGKCTPVLFGLTATEAASYTGGEWGVFLLDTRDFVKDSTGKTLRELDVSGKVEENAMAAVANKISTSADAITTADSKSAVEAGSYDLVAANVPAPTVTGIQVLGANIVVTVANTVPFVGYTLKSGADAKTFEVPYGAVSVSGNTSSEIKLVTPKTEGAQFFKVSTIK